MKCNLILHCGASRVERSEIENVPMPPATETWFPVAHETVLLTVERALRRHGLNIVQQAHSLTQDGMRYFGLLQVQNESSPDEFAWVIGIRNSHDKRFPAGIVAGSQVFVCDNLSFQGEYKLARRHTRNIHRDLPYLAEKGVLTATTIWRNLEAQIERMRVHTLSNTEVHDLIIQAVDRSVCPITLVPKVLNEWRNPRHKDFESKTVWSLYNAFTEALKGNLNALPYRTASLYDLMDDVVGEYIEV